MQPGSSIGNVPQVNSPTPNDYYNLVQSHAFSVIDGEHLISEEGLELWVNHFAPSSQEVPNALTAEIPVSWFNFIMNLLLNPDRFEWTVKLLKSPLWNILTDNCNDEDTMTFIIPAACPVSQAPI